MTQLVTVNVKGGLFGQYGATNNLSDGRSSGRFMVSKFVSSKGQLASREIMRTLLGAAAGATATKQLKRVEPNVELGGKRTIETETLVNRVTTAGDVTQMLADFLSLSARTTYGSSPVANKDGNPLGTR